MHTGKMDPRIPTLPPLPSPTVGMVLEHQSTVCPICGWTFSQQTTPQALSQPGKSPHSSDSKPPGPLSKYFTSKKGIEDEKYRFVIQHATENKVPIGWRHAASMANEFSQKLDVARRDRDWSAATDAKNARNEWQKARTKLQNLLLQLGAVGIFSAGGQVKLLLFLTHQFS